MSIQLNSAPVEKKEKVNGIVPSVAAIAGAGAISCSSVPLSYLTINQMVKSGQLSADKVEILHNTAQKAIKETGLAEKGVKIHFEPQSKAFGNWFTKLNSPVAMLQEGKNAFFVLDGQLKNTILAPEKQMSPALFHEIGHAMNKNLSKVGNTLQKFRKFAMFTPIAIALFGACTKKSKPNENNELTKWQKVKNFIRDNAGKLAIIATLPMLIEEGMATVKGEKLAKKLLSGKNEKLFKNVVKTNRWGYLSYALTSAILGLTAFSAVKIKDKLMDKKQG